MIPEIDNIIVTNSLIDTRSACLVHVHDMFQSPQAFQVATTFYIGESLIDVVVIMMLMSRSMQDVDV